MRFASLGSGSKGNGTVIDDGETCLMIDLGFTVKETVRRPVSYTHLTLPTKRIV